jgi:hypothetical protein
MSSPAISYGTIKPPSSHQQYDEDTPQPSPSIGTLHRGLSSRQVQMIAIAGTIGTGLFLGTGRSLAQGGPASMLICYAIVGFIVYVTLLLLGEMATQYPVAGESQFFPFLGDDFTLSPQGHSTSTRPGFSPRDTVSPSRGTIGLMMPFLLPLTSPPPN